MFQKSWFYLPQSPLKMKKKKCYFALKAPFVPDFFGHVGKQLDKKAKKVSTLVSIYFGSA